MASGYITTFNEEYAITEKYFVEGPYCSDAIKVLTVIQDNHSFAACTNSIVVAGTKITFGYPGFVNRELNVIASSAVEGTPPRFGTADDFADAAFVLQCVLVFFAVYMIFRGYDSGLKQ